MATPRLPVAPPAAPPAAPQVAARHRPKKRRWVSLKEAAAAAGVSETTMYRACRAKLVRARRLFSGTGHWVVRLDKDGFPADPLPAVVP